MGIEVRIVNNSVNSLPQYETAGASGMDLRAFLSEEIILEPLERKLIQTGIIVELPPGYEGQVRPRSGLAIKHGITVLNTPGTIDQDYRGYIQVILINLSNMPFTIKPGDRIAQLVISSVEKAEWKLVDELNMTSRGSGGFGHTGKN